MRRVGHDEIRLDQQRFGQVALDEMHAIGDLMGSGVRRGDEQGLVGDVGREDARIRRSAASVIARQPVPVPMSTIVGEPEEGSAALPRR